MYEFILPFKTPTINHLYFHWKGRTIMTKEAKKVRAEIEEIIVNSAFPLYTMEPGPLRVTLEIHENWLTKKGEVKKKDVANREKFLIDSVFNALGLDDKFIFEHHIFKVQNQEKEFAVVKITECSVV